MILKQNSFHFIVSIELINIAVHLNLCKYPLAPRNSTKIFNFHSTLFSFRKVVLSPIQIVFREIAGANTKGILEMYLRLRFCGRALLILLDFIFIVRVFH